MHGKKTMRSQNTKRNTVQELGHDQQRLRPLPDARRFFAAGYGASKLRQRALQQVSSSPPNGTLRAGGGRSRTAKHAVGYRPGRLSDLGPIGPGGHRRERKVVEKTWFVTGRVFGVAGKGPDKGGGGAKRTPERSGPGPGRLCRVGRGGRITGQAASVSRGRTEKTSSHAADGYSRTGYGISLCTGFECARTCP